MAQVWWVPGGSVAEALLQTHADSRPADSMGTIVERGGVRKGTLAANFASGRPLALLGLIDSGVH